MKLPKNVIALDYGTKVDLYIRFKHVDNPVGEPMKDGLAIFFYENGRGIVGVEIMDLSPFTK